MQQYDVRLVTSNDLKTRSYVTFYFNGKRVREYNGNSINLKLSPNSAKTVKERSKLLKQLEFAIKSSLENGSYLVTHESNLQTSEHRETATELTTAMLLDQALQSKLDSNLNHFYKRNLSAVHRRFIEFLTPNELSGNIAQLKRSRIQEFLNQFNTSGIYYMDKRRDLSLLFSIISKEIDKPLPMVKETTTMKKKAKLHKIYQHTQMLKILDYLKEHHTNLYLCCLLCYGCFLRPHQEIRNLKGSHFKKDCTEIHLSGDENKSGRVRTVHIPDYVRKEIVNKVSVLRDDDNLFTMNSSVYNLAYFNTQWMRVWTKMYEMGLVEVNQTIYSFRHTAAVNVFRKTKDVSIVQRLFGHSDMITTLTYLRGLGELNGDDLRDSLPEL